MQNIGKGRKGIQAKSAKIGRDNARTPLQWNDKKNEGFSSGNPLIPVNPYYNTINLAAEESSPNPALNYYKPIIRFHNEHDAMIYGALKVYDLDILDIFTFAGRSGSDRYLVLLNMPDTRHNNKPDGAAVLTRTSAAPQK